MPYAIRPFTSSSPSRSGDNVGPNDSTPRDQRRSIDQAIAQEDLTRRSDSPIANSPGKSSAGSASVSGFRSITPVVVLNTIGKGALGDKEVAQRGTNSSGGGGDNGNTNNGDGGGTGLTREGGAPGTDSTIAGLLKVILPVILPKPKVSYRSIDE